MMVGAFRVPCSEYFACQGECDDGRTTSVHLRRHTCRSSVIWRVLRLNVSAGIGVIGMASPMLVWLLDVEINQRPGE